MLDSGYFDRVSSIQHHFVIIFTNDLRIQPDFVIT